MDAAGNDFTYYTWLFILSIILDVLSHTIKEAIVRSQPLYQEAFNFRVSVCQLILSLCLIPIIKMTQSRTLEDSPFFGEKYEDMNFLQYSFEYTKFGLMCFMGIKPSDENHGKFYNDGQCSNVWVYLIGYTASLFII
jgi:predicted small integral membrane protein